MPGSPAAAGQDNARPPEEFGDGCLCAARKAQKRVELAVISAAGRNQYQACDSPGLAAGIGLVVPIRANF